MNEVITVPTRKEWLEARRTLGIGSSDAPAILGISRYKSAFQLYQEKLGIELPTKADNEQIEWGNILEEPIAQRFANETERTIINPRPANGAFTLQRSKSVEFMVASVDRFQESALIPERGVLELKNAHFFVGKSWLDLQEPPLEFQVQLQHQLGVTGMKWGSIAALIGGCRFVWADIPRDEEFITLLVKAEEEFWFRLEKRIPPDPDGSDQTRNAINRLFTREESGEVVPLSVDLIDTHIELAEAKAAMAAAKAKKQAAENRLKMAIGSNAAGRLPNGTVYTWKSQTRKEHVVKQSTFRVLRAFEPKIPTLPPGSVPPLELETSEIEEGMDTQ